MDEDSLLLAVLGPVDHIITLHHVGILEVDPALSALVGVNLPASVLVALHLCGTFGGHLDPNGCIEFVFANGLLGPPAPVVLGDARSPSWKENLLYSCCKERLRHHVHVCHTGTCMESQLFPH